MTQSAKRQYSLPKKFFRKWSMDSAGWGFWFVTFILLVGPINYVGWHFRYERSNPLIMIALCTAGAVLAAGFVTAIVNAVLTRRYKARRQAARKEKKKRNRR